MRQTIEHVVEPCLLDFVAAGTEDCDPGHSWGPGMRDYDMLHIVSSGIGHCYLNNRYYAIEAGHCFYVPSGVPVFYYADMNTPWNYCWVNFRGPDTVKTLSLCGLSVDHPVIAISNQDTIRHSIEQIMRFPRHTPANDLLIQGTFLQIMGILMSSRQSASTSEDHIQGGLVKEAIDYINDRIESDPGVRVEDVAAHLFVSRAYLFAMFRDQMGIAPRQFIMNARMSRATELLTKTSMPIDAIAQRCGYRSADAFSRAFRRENLMNPSEYRRLRSSPENVLLA